MSSLAQGKPFTCVAVAWHAHEQELRKFLRHRLADDGAADDVLQDVFVKALRQGQRFCVLDNPRAWLFDVARHAMIDRLRASRSFELLDELVLAQPEAEPCCEPVDALADCVRRSLPELTPADAEILQACDLDGETQRAYAERHGLTLTAVKSRLLRARQRLRGRITQACRVRFDAVDGRVCGHDGRRHEVPP